MSVRAEFTGRRIIEEGVNVNSQGQREPSPKENRYATLDEARAAIEGLRDVDNTKLMAIAKFFSQTRLSGDTSEAEDLLQEAITKTLAGTRRWNRSVTILKHLDRTMESDSSHIAGKRAAHPTVAIRTGKREPKSVRADVRTKIDAAEEVEKILAIFRNDSPAMDVLQLRGDGFAASEIRLKLGISEAEYETITRRIRRHLAKRLT